MRLLDLFCGGGGGAVGYHRVGFEVVGVDIKPQPHYPFEFIQHDALHLLEFSPHLVRDFDAIHASPPCQAYTEAGKFHKLSHPDLLGPTRALLDGIGLPYVIENVYKAPMRAQIVLCGTMFGLRIARHRWFEANWSLSPYGPLSCNHANVYDPWHGPDRTADKFRAAMGIDWLPIAGGRDKTGSVDLAIPPAFTEWIGAQLMKHLRERAA